MSRCMQKGVDLGRRQSWIKFQFGCLVHQSIPCQVRCCQTLCYCTFSKHNSMNQSLSEGMLDSHYVITDGGHCSMPRISPSFGPSPLKPVKVYPSGMVTYVLSMTISEMGPWVSCIQMHSLLYLVRMHF